MQEKNNLHKNTGRLKPNDVQNVHDGLISALKAQAQKGENPANVLEDLLLISKEGAYRRLKGETQLTLDEAIILAKKLEISIDNLIERNWKDKHPFHIYQFTMDFYAEEYYQMLSDIMNTYIFMKPDPNSYTYLVGRVFSPIFYFKYKEFARFTIFKWIYLVRNSTKYKTFSDVIVPPKLEQLYQPFMDASTLIPTTHILNDYMFTAVTEDLKYFFKIKLLTKNDVDVLKQQMLMIIDDLEDLAAKGLYESGARVSLYITDSYFDAGYTYINGNGIEACGIGLYGLNYLTCMNKQVCESHKDWIESLIKYSISITQSGEIQRIAFFEKQREKVNHVVV